MPTDPAATAASNLQSALSAWTSGQDPHESGLISAYETAVLLIQAEARALLSARLTRRLDLVQSVITANQLITEDATSAPVLLQYPEVGEAERLVGQCNSLYEKLPPPDVAETTQAVNAVLAAAAQLATLQNEVLS